jgi:hypothetical protein
VKKLKIRPFIEAVHMGTKGSKGKGDGSSPAVISGRVEQAIPDLQQDWAKVKGKPANKINWKKTTINKKEFAQLMDTSFSSDEIDGLFQLYDPNHVCLPTIFS